MLIHTIVFKVADCKSKSKNYANPMFVSFFHRDLLPGALLATFTAIRMGRGSFARIITAASFTTLNQSGAALYPARVKDEIAVWEKRSGERATIVCYIIGTTKLWAFEKVVKAETHAIQQKVE